MATSKRYSLFQRSVRVVQTSVRRAGLWAADRVPGLPNPPEMEEKVRAPTFVDLWEYSIADHRRIFWEVWHEYKTSFEGPSDEELESSKNEIKRAAMALRGKVSDTATQNIKFLDKATEGTKVHDNLHTLGEQGAENVKFLAKEIKHVADGVDTDAVLSHAKHVVDDTRSQDDVATTLKKNVGELRELAKAGRDAALKLEKKDVETFKSGAQSWFADKLLVGQSVLMAFIDGYREGKDMEMQRKDALLITFAKQAAEDHKDLLENQIKKIMDEQREKQRQEKEAEAAARAEPASTTDQHSAAEAAESSPNPAPRTPRDAKNTSTNDNSEQR